MELVGNVICSLTFCWHFPFSCASEKLGYGGHLDFVDFINISYFQLNALKTGIYRYSWSASQLVLSVFMCDRKRSCGGHVQLNKWTPCV